MIVFGLPMYGGMCTAEFSSSFGALRASLDLSGMPYQVLNNINDSLIPRARNCLVAQFMRDPELQDFDTFMFIDSDIQFDPEDVAKLWNLNVPVAVGCYPSKKDDGKTTAWKDGQLVSLEEFDGPTAIDFAGTGFMMVKRYVFEALQKAHPETRHVEGHVGEVYGLFQDQMSDADQIYNCARMIVDSYRGKSDRPVNASIEALEELMNADWHERWSVSEDYTFCDRWRSMGGEITLDPSIRLGHVGRKVYR